MNTLKTGFLLTLLTLILVGMGSALGGSSGAMIAFIIAAGMNFFAYWNSDKIILKMYNAEEAGPETPLYKMVEKLAHKGGLPMPKVYIIPTDSPNAFATGRNPENAAVAATRGIIALLSHDELEGVMAHELAHVANRDTLIGTVAATFAGAIAMIGSMMQWAAIFGGRGGDGGRGNVAGGLILAFIAPVAASLIQMAVSRSREYLADARGASLCGNPMALARALDRLQQGSIRKPMEEARPATAHMFIVNPLSGSSMAKFFSTHPPMEERIAKLKAMAGR
ncbi:zinc metalloprotease HtpX [Desulfobotulus mexicanus]|uniref:Protease HtpX homolog n=1 Tax=Desulfobotulus mexicanus TaxID=2586642 RepID=A0A5S5MCH5_9BACT|nr:zinc metalloprotease HtpX [Desulfobotulus mexicanus]TYT73428.1 zinc metalloprotease HtpX [Desulfobotulus mexicanus]